MNLNFAIICEHAFVDGGGRLSTIQAFDTITANKFPATHPKLTVVTNYSPEKDDSAKEINQQIEIVNPDGKKIATLTQPILPPGGQNIQLISYFLNTSLEKAGVYKVKIIFDKEIKKELPLRVIKISSAQSTPN